MSGFKEFNAKVSGTVMVLGMRMGESKKKVETRYLTLLGGGGREFSASIPVVESTRLEEGNVCNFVADISSFNGDMYLQNLKLEIVGKMEYKPQVSKPA